MSDPIPVTLSGNSTPLMPTEGLQMDLCSQCGVRPMHGPSSLLCASCELTSLRARLAEAEARAGRAEEAVRVLGAECREHRWHVDPGHREETDNAIRTTDANPAARAAVEGAQ